MWKEAVEAYFKIFCSHFKAGTETSGTRFGVPAKFDDFFLFLGQLAKLQKKGGGYQRHHVCSFVRTETIRQPMDGFSRNLVFDYFLRLFEKNIQV